MKPYLESVPRSLTSSLTLVDRRHYVPFQWHHHPEIELTLTLDAAGTRFVGDSAEAFGDNDLVLVGASVPHTWYVPSEAKRRPGRALVMWLRPDWLADLTETAVELQPIRDLCARAARGVMFSATAARAARPAILTLFEIEDPARRLLRFLDVLMDLAADAGQRTLSRRAFPQAGGDPVRARIDRVLDHLHAHYAEGVTLAELAAIAALSPSGVQRLFRRHMDMAISAYLAQLRTGAAAALLLGSDKPIAVIAREVGYDSMANFDRQFRRERGMTPRAFRAARQRQAARGRPAVAVGPAPLMLPADQAS